MILQYCIVSQQSERTEAKGILLLSKGKTFIPQFFQGLNPQTWKCRCNHCPALGSVYFTSFASVQWIRGKPLFWAVEGFWYQRIIRLLTWVNYEKGCSCRCFRYRFVYKRFMLAPAEVIFWVFRYSVPHSELMKGCSLSLMHFQSKTCNGPVDEALQVVSLREPFYRFTCWLQDVSLTVMTPEIIQGTISALSGTSP